MGSSSCPQSPFWEQRGMWPQTQGCQSPPPSSGQWLHAGLRGIRNKLSRECPGEAPQYSPLDHFVCPFPLPSIIPICVWPTQLPGHREIWGSGSRSQATEARPVCRKCTGEERWWWCVWWGRDRQGAPFLATAADRRPWSLPSPLMIC